MQEGPQTRVQSKLFLNQIVRDSYLYAHDIVILLPYTKLLYSTIYILECFFTVILEMVAMVLLAA